MLMHSASILQVSSPVSGSSGPLTSFWGPLGRYMRISLPR